MAKARATHECQDLSCLDAGPSAEPSITAPHAPAVPSVFCSGPYPLFVVLFCAPAPAVPSVFCSGRALCLWFCFAHQLRPYPLCSPPAVPSVLWCMLRAVPSLFRGIPSVCGSVLREPPPAFFFFLSLSLDTQRLSHTLWVDSCSLWVDSCSQTLKQTSSARTHAHSSHVHDRALAQGLPAATQLRLD